MARVYNSKNPPSVRLRKPTNPLSPPLSDFLFRREKPAAEEPFRVVLTPGHSIYAETHRGLFRYYGKYRK